MITIEKALQTDEPTLHNIMQFYIYEFSQYIPAIKLEENGTYKPFDLSTYWTSHCHHAFLFKLEDELIGFAMVESMHDDEPNTILEFFILRKFSGKGYGRIAAVELFKRFPGKWHITQIEKNYPAQAFWRSTISKYTSGNYSERYDEKRRSIQEFVTP